MRTYLPLALGIGGLIYALFFFGAFDTSRLAALARLLIPDVVVSLWCGGPEGTVAIFDRAAIVFAAALIWALAWATGDLLLRWLRFGSQLDRLEHYVFAQAVGLATLSTFTLLVGLAGALHTRPMFGAAAVIIVCLLQSPKFRDRLKSVTRVARGGA